MTYVNILKYIFDIQVENFIYCIYSKLKNYQKEMHSFTNQFCASPQLTL